MAHLVVADGHFVGDPGEGRRWQALLDHACKAGLTELSILGDLFELWIGLPGLEQAWQQQILAPLQRLRDSGIRLRYVQGNKDYFVANWNHRHGGLFDEVCSDRCVVESPQGPLHFAHGDLVNRADRQYRLWRRLSRSALFSLVARALPRCWLARLSRRVAEGMKSTNRYHKSYFPEAQLRGEARALPSGEATLLFGHFHTFKELQEGDKRIITLPFLGEESAGLWISDQGFERFAAPD